MWIIFFVGELCDRFGKLDKVETEGNNREDLNKGKDSGTWTTKNTKFEFFVKYMTNVGLQ